VSVFTKQYTDLLIKQYWEKPNAFAEIEMQADTWEAINDLATDLSTAFDVDTAIGKQLDIIGKRVGISRVVTEVLPGYTGLVLDDDDYRLFIRVKVAKNNSSGLMVSDERISINDVIQLAFDGEAYAVDNKDMTLTLIISYDVDEALASVIRDLDLLPKPMAVRYRFIMQTDLDNPFGFSDNPMALGFGDVFDEDIEGGVMAELVV
jgi:hypothetical protein